MAASYAVDLEASLSLSLYLSIYLSISLPLRACLCVERASDYWIQSTTEHGLFSWWEKINHTTSIPEMC